MEADQLSPWPAEEEGPGDEALAFLDEDGAEVVLDEREATSLLALTKGLEGATVSACPGCRSRLLAGSALVELLDAAPPHGRAAELVELADEAPTRHVYVQDLVSQCRHAKWRDPGAVEWMEVIDEFEEPRGIR